MTVQSIQSDAGLRHSVFPVTRSHVFLAHAGVCPLPAPVSASMVEYLSACTRGDQEQMAPPRLIHEARLALADLLGAELEEIALVGPTSLALSCVAGGFPWKAGDEVLIYQDDYPANVYPWMALREKGVSVRSLRTDDLGRFQLEDIQSQVTSSTRMVALASCHFVSGWRIDIESIGQWLRSKQIYFCVDAIQTAGAFPLRGADADFIAADSHKWLLGPCSAGFLYVRQQLQGLLRPIAVGWNNVRCPGYIAADEIQWRTGGRQFEAGSHNLAGLVGLRAACGLLTEVGVDNIAHDLIAKRNWLSERLAQLGFDLIHPRPDPVNASGILSGSIAGKDMALYHADLSREGIMTSVRVLRNGRQVLRFSPHFYNTYDELERTVAALNRMPGAG